MEKYRLDQLLVKQGLAKNPSQAVGLIMAGQVVVEQQRADKPGQHFSSSVSIRLKKNTKLHVSRAHSKISGIIEQFKLQDHINQEICLDVGSSTGGFTSCLLEQGAKSVFSVDVGSNQLDWKLRTNPQVHVYEQTDIRNFHKKTNQAFSLIVVDVSFISLRTISTHLSDLCKRRPTCKLLTLIKPQFEVSTSLIPPGGVILDQNLHAQAVRDASLQFEACGLKIEETAPSPLLGRKGNQEFFALFSL